MLALTEDGRQAFAAADAGARAEIDALVSPVDAKGRERLTEAMRDIRALLEDREAEDARLTLRPLRPGDIGWIIHRQAVLYCQEYGWDWTFEGLASRISATLSQASTRRARMAGSPSCAAPSPARFS